uniref:Uncharacterized protein n=1 Tax=Solanum lycopersicum TaxID=4081 RepID=A0A3Q7IMK1_SOLLC
KSLENEGYFQAAALVLNAPGMEVDLLSCQAKGPQKYGLSSKITSRLYDTLACYVCLSTLKARDRARSNNPQERRNNIELSKSCIVFHIVATDDPISLIALQKSSIGSGTVLLMIGNDIEAEDVYLFSYTFKRVQIRSAESAQDNAGKLQLSRYIIDKEHDVVINDTSKLITFLFHHTNKKSLVNEGYYQAVALVLNAPGMGVAPYEDCRGGSSKVAVVYVN